MNTFVWRALVRLGLFPNIYLTYSPFKIWEWEELTGDLAWRGDERVLDIGCGIGNHTLLLARQCGRIVGLDTNTAFIERARVLSDLTAWGDRAEFSDRTLEASGFADASFDRIFSVCVLEHIPDHESILAESLRCLKPGGEMIFSVDSLAAIDDPALIEKHRRDHHVQKYYSAEELAALLTSQGFVDVNVYPIFRSAYAKELFERGIRRGFNFGRFGTWFRTRKFRAAERVVQEPTAGLFLIAKARKP